MGKVAFERIKFQRIDETDDALFYKVPRLVTHIDEPACQALGDFYRANLPVGGDIIDLMSSCVSHLPEDVLYRSVTGLGMNLDELDANHRLTRRIVHDLNRMPDLPFDDASFDGCAILTRLILQQAGAFNLASKNRGSQSLGSTHMQVRVVCLVTKNLV